MEYLHLRGAANIVGEIITVWQASFTLVLPV
jgi:hypothetical protein